MTFTSEDFSDEEVIEVIREAPPSHFSFKIESFSLLAENSVEKYKSCIFQVGDYKWRLVLYPNGDYSTRNKNNDHISMYLAIADKSSLPVGWEVNVIYKFFVFDQIRDKYLTIGDVGGRVRRFHGIKTKWGLSKLISLANFTNPSNGYLVDDICEFGVELFINVQDTTARDSLTMYKEPSSYTHSCICKDFSKLNSSDDYFSFDFTYEDYEWEIQIHGENNSLSVVMHLADEEQLTSSERLYAKLKFRLIDQVHGNHLEIDSGHLWVKSTNYINGFGDTKFISLMDLKDPSKGFLRKNTWIVEAEIIIIGHSKSKRLTDTDTDEEEHE